MEANKIPLTKRALYHNLIAVIWRHLLVMFGNCKRMAETNKNADENAENIMTKSY